MCHPLAEAKIAFFCSVASALEPFLWRFQTDAPMAPVLYRELFNILLVLMKRFIKRDLMDKATTPQQLSKLDVNSKKSLKEPLIVVLKQKIFCTRLVYQQMRNLFFQRNVGTFLSQLLQKYLRKVLFVIR